MDLRHEWKHEISDCDRLVLRQRLSAVMQLDPHAIDGKYFIRSLYFDNGTDKALREKLDGDIFEVADPRGEFEQKVISEMQIAAFAEQSITEKDREILKLRMDGLTEQEIADKVGYKTASAVHKRIAKIAGAYEDYVTAEYQKYLDK